MRRITFDGLGDAESVAEQVLRQSLTTQREEAISRFIECPPDYKQLLACQAELKVIAGMIQDVRVVISRHSREGREKQDVRN